jgi:hypothetical protein
MKIQETEPPFGDIDLANILIEIEPGYFAIEHPDGRQQILITQPMEVMSGVTASVGFELDGADGIIGRPVFLHRRMQIRHLGTLDEYLEDPFVQSCIPEVTAMIDRRLGALPVIAVIEALRLDPDLDVTALVAAVLEHRQALWSAATRG